MAAKASATRPEYPSPCARYESARPSAACPGSNAEPRPAELGQDGEPLVVPAALITGPLGLCFLPAFLVLGIAPVVIGLAREALAQLDQEGLVKIVARRGIFIVRKTKAEILDMITVWAALESMAARLATKQATAEELAGLAWKGFARFPSGAREPDVAVDPV